MIYGERTRRELHHDGKGLRGTIVYLCDWTDVDPAPVAGLPQYGEPWIDPNGVARPYLRCVSASATEGSRGECEYVAQFSTEGEVAEDYCEKSLDLNLEPGPELTGWNYRDTGTPVVAAIAPPIPVGTLTIKVRAAAPPNLTVMNIMNKVNDREFHGYPIGCVLFLGAAIDNSIDLSGNVLSSAVVYKFSVKAQGHDYFWRPPLQARDIDGNLLVWQNIDAAESFYTTDQAKIGTPVWVSDVPGDESNPAGVGGWTAIEDPNGDPYFEEVDLAAELGIPGA